MDKNITRLDVISGIVASGHTTYIIGAISMQKKLDTLSYKFQCIRVVRIAEIADIPISFKAGPEVIMCSTRMKAGTAQKSVLNMLTTKND